MHPRIDENLVVWTCAECRKTISRKKSQNNVFTHEIHFAVP